MTGKDSQKAGERPVNNLRDLDDFASLVLRKVADQKVYVAEPVPRPELANRLLAAAMHRSSEAPRDVVAGMLRAGITPEAVADLYIPETARLMGQEWEDDTAGFATVSVGSSHLQTILRDLNDAWELGHSGLGVDARPMVVVMTIPEAQHILGATILTTQLRRLGCSVHRTAQIEEIDPQDPCRAIFISATVWDGAKRVRSLISSLRDMMKGSTPPIIVGGALLGALDDVVGETGADLATIDPVAALKFCDPGGK